jgi:hypothetical protein
MPRSVYDKVKEFPMSMPVSKPKGVGEASASMANMSFDEAQVIPFTGEHQPSLPTALLRAADVAKKKQAHSLLRYRRVSNTSAPKIIKLRNKAAFKIASASRVRGSVVYNSCIKPRCIYS